MLPVSRPSLGSEELEEIKKVFETGWLGLGSVVFDFEEKVKAYLDAKNVIAVNTGTSALHIALDAFGIKEGDEVIVPSLTFCASVQAVIMQRAKPVFCEINEDTLNLDLHDVEKRITSKTKAIMPVHYCGNACDMDGLLELGKKHHIIIIEDAAHAFGSSYKGKKIGSFGDVTCFSFDPIKNITCGEGGAVVLSNDSIAEEIRKKRILGIDKDTWHRYKNKRSWFYEVTTSGYRYHMSNINAAIGLVQLKKLNMFTERKREIVKIYNSTLNNIHEIKTLTINIDETAPFAYIIRVLNNQRENLMNYLSTQGVATGVHYVANHQQPFFSDYHISLPVTEKVCDEILTLPLYYEMKDNDVELVINSIKKFFAHHK